MNTFILVITPEYFNDIAMDVEEYYDYKREFPEEFDDEQD